MSGQLQQAGGQVTNKAAKWVPIFMERFFSGQVTNRSTLSDIISDQPTLRYYGGNPECLTSDSLNVEITNQLSLARRPGFSLLDAATYPAPPSRAFSFQIPGGALQLLVDTTAADGSGGLYLDNRDGSKTLLFTKPAGSGQGYFLAVGSVGYYNYSGGAGFKYTPQNTNGTTWNWGVVAPIKQPTVTEQPSGSAAATWVQTTEWSSMGLVGPDPNGNIQFLISVNASGSNSTQFGTTGNGEPAWNQTPGGTTPDNTVTWQNAGPCVEWTPNTEYGNGVGGTLANPSLIYDPASQSVYIQSSGSLCLSGGKRPNFTGIFGSKITDGNAPNACVWICLGQPKGGQSWSAVSGQVVPTVGTVSNNDSASMIFEPVLPAQIGTQPTCFGQAAITGGTAGGSGAQPPWNTTVGGTTNDGDNIWCNLGSGTWSAGRQVNAWSAGSNNFTVIKGAAGNYQVCIKTGVTGSAPPIFGTTYGQQSAPDGTALWICVGPSVTWAANTKWYLPPSGFAPPQQGSQPYSSALIVDTNGNIQGVVKSGLSKSGSHPSWNTALNGLTTDGSGNLTWINLGPASANSLSWQNGYTYGYSYKSRAADDFYVTNTPPGLNAPLGAPTGSGTGAVSTASPVFIITGSNSGSVNLIKGLGSIDPGVDTIVIWRSADQTPTGDGSNLLELTEIPNPAPVGGVAQAWSFSDFLPDAASALYPGLNAQIPAPIDDQNDPPPVGFLPQAYWFDRIWGVLGNQVFFSQGPDEVSGGNPNEAFQPSDEFEFLADVVRLVKTSAALICFLTDSIEAIQGGPLTASFSQVSIAPGIGLGNFNGLDVFAGEIFFFANSRELMLMTPNLQLSGAGFAVADRLAEYDPTKAYVAFHTANNDTAFYISNGSTEYRRCNPRQSPFGTAVWSPRATPVNGIQLLQSVETSAGVKQLLIGSTGSNKPILFRDLNNFSDNGEAYEAFGTVGSIVLASSPHFAVMRAIDAIFTNVGDSPEVSVLMNEVEALNGAAFQPLSLEESSPTFLYGDSGVLKPKSYNPLRWYFASNDGVVSRCNFLSVKFDFGTDTVKNEVINFSLTGKLLSEI
jgi:hypothetical protein